MSDSVKWLRAKYRRHGEIEDKLAADEIERQSAEIAALKERVLELETQLSTATDALQVRWQLNPSTSHFVIEGE